MQTDQTNVGVWSKEHVSLPLCSLLVEGSEPGCGQMAGAPLVEDPPHRLRWQAHLEFTHNHDVGDLTWDKIAVSLPRSEKLRSLVLAGIPHGMRPQVRWPQRQGPHRELRVLWPVTKETAVWLLPPVMDATVWGTTEEEEL